MMDFKTYQREDCVQPAKCKVHKRKTAALQVDETDEVQQFMGKLVNHVELD